MAALASDGFAAASPSRMGHVLGLVVDVSLIMSLDMGLGMSVNKNGRLGLSMNLGLIFDVRPGVSLIVGRDIDIDLDALDIVLDMDFADRAAQVQVVDAI